MLRSLGSPVSGLGGSLSASASASAAAAAAGASPAAALPALAGLPAYSAAATAAFARAFPGLFFSARGLDGKEIELVRGGCAVRLTLERRWQWVAATLNFHLTACDAALRHIRRGLYALVPARALRLLSWRELALSVAGQPEINVRQLREHTLYEGYRPSDTTIAMFWRVFEGFSNAERALFVRFAYGRSRLPQGRKWGSVRLKISRRPPDDNALPSSHTCFFAVDLPPYSTEARMRTALLAAIYYSGGVLSA